MPPGQPEPFALPCALSSWFSGRGWSPRPYQLELAAAIAGGNSALLVAPTGGGKTLAGFLASLSDLVLKAQAGPREARLHTLYVSPLKALAADIERNIMTPVVEMGLPIRVESRTGDTPAHARTRQRRIPPDILVTTPEQLALMVAADDPASLFAGLECVIIDEIHTFPASKRGDLLSLCLSALAGWAPQCRFVGLSATVSEPERLARWLDLRRETLQGAPGEAGPDPCAVQTIISPARVAADVSILVSGERIPWAGHSGRFAVGEVYQAICAARLSLVFVNTRSQAEILFQELWEANEHNLPIGLHHGSLARERRARVEAAMAAGALRAVVCTSTLDLGIDWGHVDLVIQIGAPKGSARLIQRIGRSNHRLEEASRALLVPTNRFEVLECQAARAAVEAGEADDEITRAGALDILAQHVMGRACGEGFRLDSLFEEIRRAPPYQSLSWEVFEKVVDFVATGGYALRSYDRFRRIIRSPDGVWRARTPRDRQAHRMNVGAITEAPMLSVRLASAGPSGKPGMTPSARGEILAGGRKLGEIEEYFVSLLKTDDTFLFGGEVLRFIRVDGSDVIVTPTHSDKPSVPSYNGGKFPLTTFLADRVRRLIHERDQWPLLPDPVQEWFARQAEYSLIPLPDQLLVETFPRGDRHYLVAYPFEGRLAHQTLGMLLTRRLERAGVQPAGFVASEYAIAVWAMSDMRSLDMEEMFHPDMLGDDLEEWLDESALMRRTFGQCARISGLIHRNLPGSEKTGRQVSFSTDLIFDVLRRHEPDHILLQATRADAASGLLDVRRLSDMLQRISGRICHQRLARISPFAVPVMLEVGREPVAGAAFVDAVLREAEAEMVRDAMGGPLRLDPDRGSSQFMPP